jgi:hypothetical protein
MTGVSDTVIEGIELIIVLALMLALFGVFGFALIHAARIPHPASLVTALALLTTLVIVAFIVTEADALIGLAGAGIGALAGAVASVYNDKNDTQGPHQPGKQDV